MKPSDSILIDRMKVNGMLRLSRNASYSRLPRSRFKGKVRMVDVRNLMLDASRNGAEWSGGELTMLTGRTLGISQRSLFRALKSAPHFRITRKVALVETDRIEDFLGNKKTHKGGKRQ